LKAREEEIIANTPLIFYEFSEGTEEERKELMVCRTNRLKLQTYQRKFRKISNIQRLLVDLKQKSLGIFGEKSF
jgi:hypothetical protein